MEAACSSSRFMANLVAEKKRRYEAQDGSAN